MNTKHFLAGVAVGTLLTLNMPAIFVEASAQDPHRGEALEGEELLPVPEELPPALCPPCPPCPKDKSSEEIKKALEAIKAVEQLEQQQVQGR